jgi:PAS domain S-box-containing protein
LLGAWAQSAALVFCRDPAGRLLACNPAFARKFGLQPRDAVGQSVHTWLHPEDTPPHADSERALALAAAPVKGESRWLTPQGWRWLGWEEAAVNDADGHALGFRCVAHDITRQRVAEEQFYKLSRAVEQSPVAMLITDAEGVAQYVNAKFTEVTGYTLESLLDNQAHVLREGHPTEDAYRQFWAEVSSGREWRGELPRDRLDGTRVWEAVQVSCLRNPAGEITNYLRLSEDITARKALEDQLRQAQKMDSLGTLAGGIAHDFNNILAVISGYAEFVLMNQAEDAIRERCLQEIKKATSRATGLVRQILTFSRKAEVRFAPLDLNQHVRDLIAMLTETFPRTLSLQLELEEKLPALRADQNQLQQVVLNLCVNARDAMEGPGTLTLSTRRATPEELPANLPKDRTYACLAVRDTGSGMAPEVRARIFEPFFTTKAVNKGTGLGLAVVYGIVASHEGAIEVDTAPGAGTTFRVYLPLTEAAACTILSGKSEEFPGGHESVLVVDDEAPLRNLLEAALGRRGYRIATAADGLEAIERIMERGGAYDAVLLDLNMPGASGLEVYKVIRATHPGLKVLVITGHLTPDARAEFERMGQHNFIKKPYTLGELGRSLRTLLEHPARN